MSKIKELELAAGIFGCNVEEILSFRLLPSGGINIIAPTGQKFTYSDGELEEQLHKVTKPEPKPRRKAPLARKRAPAKKPAASKAKAQPASKADAKLKPKPKVAPKADPFSTNDEKKH